MSCLDVLIFYFQNPTVAGIPLSLNLTGTAVLRTSGDMSMTPGTTRDLMGYVSRGIHTEVGVRTSIKNRYNLKLK
jgi:hypothetical protein